MLRGKNDDPVFLISLKSEYKCPICMAYLIQPQHIEKCGHSFCKNCFDEYKTSTTCGVNKGKPFVCPIDKQVINEERVFTDNRLQREIEDLKVYCKNKGLGCEDTCELRNYQDHIEKCGYNMVSCPLECGKQMRSKAIQTHQRDQCHRRQSRCVICDQEMEYHILKNEHDSVCPMKEVSCDYCETAVMLRKESEDHHNTVCASYPTFCIFAPLGCKEKIKREDLESHHDISSQKHLSMLSTAAINIYDAVGVKFPVCEFGGETVPYELPVQLRATMSENIESASLLGVGSGGRNQHAEEITLVEKMKKIETDNNLLLVEIEKLKAVKKNFSTNVKIVKQFFYIFSFLLFVIIYYSIYGRMTQFPTGNHRNRQEL